MLVKLGRQGGKKRAANLTKKQRVESARHAAETRWARYREAKLKSPPI